ncbi:MAG: pyridoxal 5'-phosphate synthase glutaminase subunit PdxT, partial [Patescibacteria group bacterium]
MKTIGVLALQGAFIEHVNIYKRLGVPVIEVRNKKDLDQVQGLIMPGGESTSNKLLLKKTGLDLEIIKRAKKDLAIWGVCAGIILLADLGLLDVEVERNAYGRQLDSFESPLSSEKFPKLEGVFIRAPKITKVGKG